jgi:hypothetical protein
VRILICMNDRLQCLPVLIQNENREKYFYSVIGVKRIVTLLDVGGDSIHDWTLLPTNI